MGQARRRAGWGDGWLGCGHGPGAGKRWGAHRVGGKMVRGVVVVRNSDRRGGKRRYRAHRALLIIPGWAGILRYLDIGWYIMGCVLTIFLFLYCFSRNVLYWRRHSSRSRLVFGVVMRSVL